MMSRTWTASVFQAFTPTWYREMGYGPAFYGPLATTLVLASAVGTLGCGSFADRYGRRTVILATLVLTLPAIFLYTKFPGPWAFGSAILIGFLAASTAPLLLLMAQQLLVTVTIAIAWFLPGEEEIERHSVSAPSVASAEC